MLAASAPPSAAPAAFPAAAGPASAESRRSSVDEVLLAIRNPNKVTFLKKIIHKLAHYSLVLFPCYVAIAEYSLHRTGFYNGSSWLEASACAAAHALSACSGMVMHVKILQSMAFPHNEIAL